MFSLRSASSPSTNFSFIRLRLNSSIADASSSGSCSFFISDRFINGLHKKVITSLSPLISALESSNSPVLASSARKAGEFNSFTSASMAAV